MSSIGKKGPDFFRYSSVKPALRFSVLYLAVAMSLSACATMHNSSPASTPAPSQPAPSSPSPSSPSSPSPTPSQPAPANVAGYNGVIDNQTVPTGAQAANNAGYTGQGVKLGDMDTGADMAHGLGLNGHVVWYNKYWNVTDPQNVNNIANAKDGNGHGTIMLEVIGGSPESNFAGGIAQGAQLYEAQTCGSNGECGTYTTAYKQMMADGVHIFNQSYGSLSSEAVPAYLQNEITGIGTQYAALGTSNLYVWSAGDLFDGQPQSDINVQALVPEYTPSLEGQWLVATSVHINSQGEPDGLSSYAPDCGAAMDWCIDAPGYLETPPISGTNYTSGLSEGTSASSAEITGVAGLIQGAYLWYTPQNITDDMLTTATHLGSGPADAPNSTYGWGIVNAYKAVFGPGQFAFGAFNANIGAYNSTFSNDIGGSGSLNLSGTTGTLTLTGNNTYSGGTTVNSGNLLLPNGAALGSGVTVDSGTFGGAGTVNGDVTNSETGSVISDSGTGGQGLTINGNYTAGKDSTTEIGLASPLTVSGTAELDGTLEVLAPPKSYDLSSQVTLIEAGVLSGTFAQQTYGAGVYYTLSNLQYSSTELTGTVTRDNVAQQTDAMAIATPREKYMATVLQSVLEKAGNWDYGKQMQNLPFLDGVAAFLSSSNDQQATGSLKSLNGSIYSSAQDVENREAMLRSRVVMQNDVHASKMNAWAQVFYNSGNAYSPDAESGNTSYYDQGVVAGLDIPVFHQDNIGIAFDHDRLNGTAHNTSHGNFSDETNQVDLSGRWGSVLSGPYLAGELDYGWSSAQVNRTIQLAQQEEGAIGNVNSQITTEALQAGYRLHNWTPYIGWTGIENHQDGFTESGSALGLTVPGNHSFIDYSSLGLRFNHSLGRHGWLFLWASWQHLLNGHSTGMNGYFSAMPSIPFSINGENNPENIESAGAFVDYKITHHWTVSGNWSISRYHHNDITNNFDLAVNYGF